MKWLKFIVIVGIFGVIIAVSAFVTQHAGEYFRGLSKMDTLQMVVLAELPSNPEAGYTAHVNGYYLWYNGSSWDTLNGGGSGGGLTESDLDGIRDTLDLLTPIVPLNTLAPILIDTGSFTFQFGYGLTGDSAACYEDAKMGTFPWPQDTLYGLVIDSAFAEPSGASVAVAIEYDESARFFSPTTIWSGTLTYTPTYTTTFTVTKVPPDVYIRARITSTPADANKANYIVIPYEFCKIRQ